ncbi:hypothetical protein MJN85_29235, partial [Salmonella enterica subsp. enterica serovar Anatum]|nr:hypothetical protein [Salmonella enterica subsp. enterica serovar Anatum]
VNSEEVMDYQWSEFKSVWKSLLATPWAFSPWMVMQASDEQARWLDVTARRKTVAITLRDLEPFDKRLGTTQQVYEQAFAQVVNR